MRNNLKVKGRPRPFELYEHVPHAPVTSHDLASRSGQKWTEVITLFGLGQSRCSEDESSVPPPPPPPQPV